jgi:TRAP-type C4-dicarboxylate transport system permease large subunit
VALLSATGAQTETIPPSIVLITIGSVTGVSIAALFTGGLLPAVVLGAALCAVVWWRYRHEDLSGVQRHSKREIGKLADALPAMHAALRDPRRRGRGRGHRHRGVDHRHRLLGAGRALRVPAVRLARLKPMLIDTASLSGAIIFIIGCATAMAWGLTQSGFSQDLARVMGSLPGGAYGFLAVSIVAFIVLGSVLEGIPAIVLFGPLLFPIAKAWSGVHEVHYAMVVIFSMGIGLFAPPFGVGYYGACAVSKVNPDEGIKHIWGYIGAMLVGLVIVAAVPVVLDRLPQNLNTTTHSHHGAKQ